MSSQTRLFIGNLPDNTKENDLVTAFSSFGEIIALDLKTKPSVEEDAKKFAFVTLSAPNCDVESCIKHFSNESFNGNKLHVTRARESFLERLQKERELAAKKEIEKNDHTESIPKKIADIKLSDKLNPRKRRLENTNNLIGTNNDKKSKVHNTFESHNNNVSLNTKETGKYNKNRSDISEENTKKVESDKKRMDAMRKKRQEFKDKQMIIKTALVGLDKVQNKKVKFSDDEDISPTDKATPIVQHVKNNNFETHNKKNNLFDSDADSDDEVSFAIKKQFEGKKGQKVLDLQSRYKSDKRFVLDKRFIDDERSEDEKDQEHNEESQDEKIDIQQSDEKLKQLNILQDVLGVAITHKFNDSKKDEKKIKSKLGMVRFDPTNPEHTKFIAKVETKEVKKGSKAKKSKIDEKDKEVPQPEEPKQESEKVQVSKEQFYRVDENLKEAFTQSNTFSLRSLFGSKEEDTNTENQEQNTGYIPIEEPKSAKVKNPLDIGAKNPFVYDSTDSETEEIPEKVKKSPSKEQADVKTVWNEKLFFSKSDYRFKEALVFFNKTNEGKGQNERRQLKSLMKKRIYNTERKNQMFQKKIGGRKKTMKKSFKKKL